MPELIELNDCAIEKIVEDNFGDSVNPVYAFKDEVNVVEEKYVAEDDLLAGLAGNQYEKPSGIASCQPNSAKEYIAEIQLDIKLEPNTWYDLMFYVTGKATKSGITDFFQIETTTTVTGNNRYIIDENNVFEAIVY